MDAASQTGRSAFIALWVLRVIVAALFLTAAFFKLTGQQMMVDEFNVIGLGQWFRFVTGAIELVGGVLILVPSLSVFGAILLLLVDLRAFVTQLFVLHGDVIHTIVIGALIVAVIILQRGRLRTITG